MCVELGGGFWMEKFKVGGEVEVYKVEDSAGFIH